MTTRILLDPDGSGLLVEPGSYLLWEPEFPILVPTGRVVDVRALIRQPTVPGGTAMRVVTVPSRTGVIG